MEILFVLDVQYDNEDSARYDGHFSFSIERHYMVPLFCSYHVRKTKWNLFLKVADLHLRGDGTDVSKKCRL